MSKLNTLFLKQILLIVIGSSCAINANIALTPTDLAALQASAEETAIKSAYKTAYELGFKCYDAQMLASGISFLENTGSPIELYFNNLEAGVSTATATTPATPFTGYTKKTVLTSPLSSTGLVLGTSLNANIAEDKTMAVINLANICGVRNLADTASRASRLITGDSNNAVSCVSAQNKNNVFLVNKNNNKLMKFDLATPTANATYLNPEITIPDSSAPDAVKINQTIAAGTDGTLWFIKTPTAIAQRNATGKVLDLEIPTKNATANVLGIAARGNLENFFLMVLDSEQKIHFCEQATANGQAIKKWNSAQFQDVSQVAIGSQGTAAIRIRLDQKTTNTTQPKTFSPAGSTIKYAVGGAVLFASKSVWQQFASTTLPINAQSTPIVAPAPVTTGAPAANTWQNDLLQISSAQDSTTASSIASSLLNENSNDNSKITQVVDTLFGKYESSNSFGKMTILQDFVTNNKEKLGQLNNDNWKKLLWDWDLAKINTSSNADNLISLANEILNKSTTTSDNNKIIKLLETTYERYSRFNRTEDKQKVLKEVITPKITVFNRAVGTAVNANWQKFNADLAELSMLGAFTTALNIQNLSVGAITNYFNNAFAQATGLNAPFVNDQFLIVADKQDKLVLTANLRTNSDLRQKINALIDEKFNNDIFNKIYEMTNNNVQLIENMIDTLSQLFDVINGNALEILEELNKTDNTANIFNDILTKITQNITKYDDPISIKNSLYQKILALADCKEGVAVSSSDPQAIKINYQTVPNYVLNSSQKFENRELKTVYGSRTTHRSQQTFSALEAIKKNITNVLLEKIAKDIANDDRTALQKAEILENRLDDVLNKISISTSEASRILGNEERQLITSIINLINQATTGSKPYYNNKEKAEEATKKLQALVNATPTTPTINSVVAPTTNSMLTVTPPAPVINSIPLPDRINQLLNPATGTLQEFLSGSYATSGMPSVSLINKFISDLRAIVQNPNNPLDLNPELAKFPEQKPLLINALNMLLSGRGTPVLNDKGMNLQKENLLKTQLLLTFPLVQINSIIKRNNLSFQPNINEVGEQLEIIINLNTESFKGLFKESEIANLMELKQLITEASEGSSRYYSDGEKAKQALQKLQAVIDAIKSPAVTATSVATATPTTVVTPAVSTDAQLLSQGLTIANPLVKKVADQDAILSDLLTKIKTAKKAKDKETLKTLNANRKTAAAARKKVLTELTNALKSLAPNQLELLSSDFVKNTNAFLRKAFIAGYNLTKPQEPSETQ